MTMYNKENVNECNINNTFTTGCVFSNFLKYIFRTLVSLGFPALCTPNFMLGPLNGRKNSGAAAELAELRKIKTF